ncbi:unnamed protein product, partial [Mesorhabditis spiculigera]
MHSILAGVGLIALLGAASAVVFPTAQQTEIMNVHNNFRSNLSKGTYKAKDGTVFAKATNMRQMVWNSTLATKASAYANTCPGLKHSGAAGVGENLYIVWGGRLNGLGAAGSNAWANEFYTYGPVGYTFSSKTGHATQMAWATTTAVGCGYQYCTRDKSYFVVCNYWPPGNYIGQKAYEQGTTCSKCPTGTKCTLATGLCA